ncbi:type VI secretion system tip protein VgrG [Dickeya fangzhongdai]|uniref:Rhs element Vgr protein n=1 Tax=Dickeya fangzhongdai TaxID=1778540 RepID=A0A2K8QMW6_9GAMM|nr:type VI secretion system tip protein VgrG [Dickeya fangzhongdai]ATZ94348.1 Rhs element Vgr protein [Dickeya fangzhongdai]QOH47785.1 type VI secretion system tip protein VgrG [Dickeya fangzhongdai]QOH52090.1 type VI secretion system tip protein VgrG [Dickeya fangzhongdai]WOY00705.1 type VI secretion system tip protein VgrG [Dickeya fangzhongdai]WOY04145.1 type VI secretion system tip protein VgrG [Dickeya fangzhongdai]
MSGGATSGGVATHEITANGTAIPGDYQVRRIQIQQRINHISRATLEILDGSASQENFTVSASSTFVPGAEIVINLGYDSTNKKVFSGIVTRQSLQVNPGVGPLLVVECRDSAIKMSVGRKSAAYQNKTDSDVMSTLIGQYGLSKKITSTTATLPELVQYYCSDWDFMLSRAEVNGLVVSTLNGTVSVFSPTANTQSVLTVTYGAGLYHFSAGLNAVTQLAQVKASAWDDKSQQCISATAANSLAGPGNLSSKTLSGVVGLSDFALQTTAALDNDALTQWSKAQMLKSELAKITGEVRFQGDAAVTAGNYLTISGMGNRFDGDYFVSGIEHDYADGNWFTCADLGLSPLWFVQEHDVMAPSAAGLLPGVEGLYNATVKKTDQDPDNAYRILVELPLFNDGGKGLWARLANFYSSSGVGAFFLPEVGDEVIVGFLNQDPRFPIILGSVYSANRKPYSELTPNAENSKKAIVTKSELRIVFDDKDSIMTITTKGNNVIVLDDKKQQISITDQHNNAITMSSSGIDIKSPSTINIQADQKVNIKGNLGVTVQASSGDVKVSGLNVNASADMSFNAKGSATAEVQGGAELTLKGAVVMIN